MTETIELPDESKPGWDGQAPLSSCYGFKASASNLKLWFGYSIFAQGVVSLWCLEQIGGMHPQPWRQIWTGFESAVDVAEDLCADMEDYLDSVSTVYRRPSEDLDMDDFLHHLHLRVTNGLH